VKPVNKLVEKNFLAGAPGINNWRSCCGRGRGKKQKQKTKKNKKKKKKKKNIKIIKKKYLFGAKILELQPGLG